MELRAKFKRCIDQACEHFRLNPAEFARQRGLRDFVIDAFESDPSCRKIAARALVELCQSPPNLLDGVVCIAVIDFLDESIGAPQQDETRARRAKDLHQLVADSATHSAYLGWIEAWYS